MFFFFFEKKTPRLRQALKSEEKRASDLQLDFNVFKEATRETEQRHNLHVQDLVKTRVLNREEIDGLVEELTELQEDTVDDRKKIARLKGEKIELEKRIAVMLEDIKFILEKDDNTRYDLKLWLEEQPSKKRKTRDEVNEKLLEKSLRTMHDISSDVSKILQTCSTAKITDADSAELFMAELMEMLADIRDMTCNGWTKHKKQKS